MILEWVATSSISARSRRDCRHVYQTTYRGLSVAYCQDGCGNGRFGVLNPKNPMLDPVYQCEKEEELMAFVDNLPRAQFYPGFSEVLRLRSLCESHGIDPDAAILPEPQIKILLSELMSKRCDK